MPPRDPEEGSNAWAFAPSRTKSGRAILLRNPHLSWTAGYYEAHVTVPGVLDFYGDFRIGGPFGVIGGFNRHLGWATTNNAPDLDEIYMAATQILSGQGGWPNSVFLTPDLHEYVVAHGTSTALNVGTRAYSPGPPHVPSGCWVSRR